MYSNSHDLTDVSPVYSHNPYDATSFPLLVLNVQRHLCVPPNEGFRMLHWHEEVQFVCVISGSVRITVYSEEFLLHAGDCMFLNRNSLHLVSGIGDCHYHSFLIPVRMLSFFSGSIMQQKDVEAFTENPSFTCVPVYGSVSEYGSFLRELETLASAAHISKTECLRCFRRFVQESPYQYLIRYRLHMSTVLLTTTDRPVTDIALEVGFHSASSYIRYFKERYQMTPKQYQKTHADVRCGS